MRIANPDFQEESTYFAYVKNFILRKKAENVRGKGLPENPGAAAGGPGATNPLVDHVERRAIETDRLNEHDPYFGRIDELDDFSYYIGPIGINFPDSDGCPHSHRDVHSATNGRMVISAMAPAAAKFYTARPDNSLGVVRKRQYEVVGGELVQIYETLFGDRPSQADPEDGVPVPNYEGRLKRILEAPRSDQLQPITATITPEQYEVIDLPIGERISLQGGPGTGKSVVALHRLATLAFRNSTELKSSFTAADLLFIAPSDRFLNYVRRLVPEQLGQSAVEQREFKDCFSFKADFVERSFELRQVKGDLRMAAVLELAVWSRLYPTAPVVFDFKNVQCAVSAVQLLDLIRSVKARAAHYSAARTAFIQDLNDLICGQYEEAVSTVLRAAEIAADIAQLRVLLDTDLNHRRAIARVAPKLEARTVLLELKKNPRFFRESWLRLRALGNQVDRTESVDGLDELYRFWAFAHENPEEMSDVDIPLLVELDFLIDGKTYNWRHIAVDEVQDRQPMELRAISRLVHREGGVTLLGDLAQATGPWYYEDWQAIWQALASDVSKDHHHLSLPIGFRVPSSILEYAQEFRSLLDIDLEPMAAVKTNEEGLHQLRVDLSKGVGLAMRLINSMLSTLATNARVGVIAPEEHANEIVAFLAERHPGMQSEIATIDECKGMEYDVCIVVDVRSLLQTELETDPHMAARKIWVAYTRGTKALVEISSSGEPPILETVSDAIAEIETASSGRPDFSTFSQIHA